MSVLKAGNLTLTGAVINDAGIPVVGTDEFCIVEAASLLDLQARVEALEQRQKAQAKTRKKAWLSIRQGLLMAVNAIGSLYCLKKQGIT